MRPCDRSVASVFTVTDEFAIQVFMKKTHDRGCRTPKQNNHRVPGLHLLATE